MNEFFRMLTELIKKYTIADTANVFSIIEGIATVVAAIGAIIAVVVTRKIAKEQINLAKKQNEISAAQAEISRQQNKIALLEVRSSVYDNLIPFFSNWQSFSAIYLEGIKATTPINSLQAYISMRELGRIDTDYIKKKSLFDLQIKHSDLFIKDITCISQVLRLFSLPKEYESILGNVMLKYREFSQVVNLMKDPEYSTQELEKIGSEIDDYMRSPEWMILIRFLEEQISFDG